ncbi:hypothetical protein NBY09_19720, partial [Elizabethkingia anophelis]|nr:hypothetical protein [Elizabethkingia anophelis]
DKSEIEKYNLIRVDSTIVADTCSKLKEGIDQKSGKKLVKFSFSFDGILPSGVEVFYRSKIFFRRIGTFRSNFKTSQKRRIS